MSEKNLGQKVALIVAVLVLGALLLVRYDHERGFGLNLRAGQDIAGGVSMIFEINDEGAENQPDLANQMKELLQRRVDPQGVFDLTWRVHGRNRIEVSMPLPPPEAKKLQADFIEAREALVAKVPKASAIEAALRLPPEERSAKLQELAAGIATRQALLEKAAERYDAYQKALARLRGDAPASSESMPTNEELELAVRDAQELYEDALDAAVDSSLNLQMLQNVLEMARGSKARETSLANLKADHPELAADIDRVVEAYEKWDKQKGKLDGPADLQRLLKGAGVMEFRILAQPTPENAARYNRYRDQLHQFGPRPRAGDTEAWFRIDNPVAFFNLPNAKALENFDYKNHGLHVVEKMGDDFYVLASNEPDKTMLHRGGGDWKLDRVAPDRDPQSGRLTVSFQFDAVGAAKFGELTGRNVNRQLCILVDDVAYSAANIVEKITRHGQISGDFSVDKIEYLVQTMQAGALPARLKDTPLSERTIGSALGQQNLSRALMSGVIALIVVCGFLCVYYGWCGAIATFGLLMNVMLTLSMMALLQARITLPGIAGLILSLGMVVDANVLIYERMREEKERGSSLRMMIKNGYDKAISTIIDSNVTVILTAIIMYYAGSEEIKGFGLTLGWGVMLSMFTSVFVTRVLFALLVRSKLMTDIKMLKLLGVPTFDWWRRRRQFLAGTSLLIVVGLAILFMRPTERLFDVEFNGGVAAEIELDTPVKDEEQLRARLKIAADTLMSEAGRIAQATVTPAGEGRYQIQVPGLRPRLIEAIVAEPLEDKKWLARGGIDRGHGDDYITVRLDGPASVEEIQNFVRSQAGALEYTANVLGRASFGLVLEEGEPGKFWNITTTEKNRRIVQHALEEAFGDQLVRQPQIAYVFRGDNGVPYPITESRLESVIPGLPAGTGADVTDYRGGAAIWFDQLSPAQSVEALRERLRAMRLQPGYQDYPFRTFDVIGITPTGDKDKEGRALYSSVVLVVNDPALRYSDDADRWEAELATPEFRLASAAFDTEQSLRRVSQFKPQVAASSARKALISLLLSWMMIIAYMWVRFGKASYGISGVVTLVHDVLLAVAAVGLSGWIANFAFARYLLIEDFRIDMTVIAALLTIIGFSINDTIVIFDRIRELRGRLGQLTPQIINDAINQTLSRTIITSMLVISTILIMYIWGGSSIRGFNFCMLVGCLRGLYSSIAIAAPLLLILQGHVQPDSRSAARRPQTA
jgi:SecD/SecF fusion protein